MSKASEWAKIHNKYCTAWKNNGYCFQLRNKLGSIVEFKISNCGDFKIGDFDFFTENQAIQIRDWLTEMFDESTSAGNG